MADRLVVMSHGEIQQVGTQRDLYERPRNRFVAGFVGRTNFFGGTLEATGLFRTDGGLAIRCDGAAGPGRRLLALRPEKIAIAPTPRTDLPNSQPGTVEFASYLGALTEYHVRLASGEIVMVQSTNHVVGGGREMALGEGVHLAWPAEACLLLAEGEGPAPPVDPLTDTDEGGHHGDP